MLAVHEREYRISPLDGPLHLCTESMRHGYVGIGEVNREVICRQVRKAFSHILGGFLSVWSILAQFFRFD